MSFHKIQSQPDCLYQDQEWSKMRTSLFRQHFESERQNIVTDQILIQEQNQLLEEIKEKIKRSKYKQMLGNMEDLPIDSSISNISSQYNFGDDESLIKNKFTEEFESCLLNSALKEVKNSCTEQTYDTVKNYLLNNKQKQCENLMKMLSKKEKENEQLSLAIIIKQNEVIRLKQQMAPYVTKAEFFEQEKKKWKRKQQQLNQKQIMLHKMEKTFIFKQKMHQQAKRRGQKLKQFTDGIYTKMKQIESELNSLRISIEQRMNKLEGQKCCEEADKGQCWKKEIMKKYREKLLEERSILKQEQKDLEKRYEILENVSEQCKKLVSDSYEGLVSLVGSGGSAIQPSQKEDRHEKPTSMSVIDKR